MLELFTGADILNMGIEAEVLGEAFYTSVAAQPTDKAISEACTTLAADERGHARVLREMLSEWQGAREKLQADQETMDYVHALLGRRLLPQAQDAEALIRGAKGLPELLQIAAALEKDSILFYYEMRDLVGRQSEAAVTRLIGEEKTHLAKVQRMAAELL